MALGSGKYGEACTVARDLTGGQTVVLIVLDGQHGNGFEVQSANLDQQLFLPKLLREMASLIEAENTNQFN